MRVALALLVLCTAVGLRPAAGQDDTGTVTGRLLRLDGPVPGARVIAKSSTRSDYEASTVTEADGGFTISEVPLGEVEVLVYLPTGELAARGGGVLDEPGEVLFIPLGPPS